MKKLHGVRILGGSWQMFLPFLARLYKLQEIEGKRIIKVKERLIGCSTEEFGRYHEIFKMIGGKTSEPHLHLVEKTGKEKESEFFALTSFGRKLGQAYLLRHEQKAKRLLFLRCVECIPQFRCFLQEIVKSGAIYRRGKYQYFSNFDETMTLDTKIKISLSEQGYDATCNPQTIDQFIRFCKGYRLIEYHQIGTGKRKYELRLSELMSAYPEVYAKVKSEMVDLDFFVKMLNEKYLELSAGRRIFVPVSMLREKVQEQLNIRKEVFDHIVVELEKFNPNEIRTRAGPADLLGEPLLKDTSKSLIMIKTGKIFIPTHRITRVIEGLRV